MKKAITYRSVAMFVATISAFFGFTGMTSAQINSIQNTGPYSSNKVVSKQSENCTVKNNNSISAANNISQNAQTGDVMANGNTTVGSGWGAWDPATWAAQGHTYAEWHAAFTAYMASVESNWGSMSGVGVSSGNASNSNNSQISININNSAATGICSQANSNEGKGGGSIDTTGPNSTNSIRNITTANGQQTNNTGVDASNNTSQNAHSGNVSAYGNTYAGGGGSGRAYNGSTSGSSTNVGNGGSSGGSSGGNTPGFPTTNSSISNTGPSSNNTISNHVTSNTSVTNNTNVSNINNTGQSSSSGNVTSSNNTTAGGSSGTAGNSASSQGTVSVH